MDSSSTHFVTDNTDTDYSPLEMKIRALKIRLKAKTFFSFTPQLLCDEHPHNVVWSHTAVSNINVFLKVMGGSPEMKTHCLFYLHQTHKRLLKLAHLYCVSQATILPGCADKTPNTYTIS